MKKLTLFIAMLFAALATEAAPLWMRYPAISPDGKQIAFVSRGEIFVTAVDYPTTKQITTTAESESSPSWGADNRTLAYASERNGYWNIYIAKIARAEDPNFPNATVIEEKPLFKDDKIDRTEPHFSPDGKELAYVEDRCRLMVKNIENAKEIAATVHVPGCKCTFEKISTRPAMEKKEENVRVLEKVNEIFAKYNIPTLEGRALRGGSDAAYITQCSIPCMDSLGTVGGGSHSVNEFAHLSSLAESAKRIAAIVANITED